MTPSVTEVTDVLKPTVTEGKDAEVWRSEEGNLITEVDDSRPLDILQFSTAADKVVQAEEMVVTKRLPREPLKDKETGLKEAHSPKAREVTEASDYE